MTCQHQRYRQYCYPYRSVEIIIHVTTPLQDRLRTLGTTELATYHNSHTSSRDGCIAGPLVCTMEEASTQAAPPRMSPATKRPWSPLGRIN